MATDLLTSIMAKQYQSAQIDDLLYLTDGLTIPKMFDGTDIVNWGIVRPSSAPTAAGSSTGLNDVDLCESAWTPASTVIEDCEDAWTLDSAWDGDGLATVSSSFYKVGAASALFLLGTDVEPLTANTKLMLHCNGVDAGTTFTDSSQSAHTVTAQNDAQLDTDQYKFDTASALFDGTGDYLSIADSADWDWGTGAYTVDMWIRPSATPVSTDLLFATGGGYGGGSAKGFALAITPGGGSSGLIVYQNGANLGLTSYTFAADTWYHIRVCRSGTNIYVFVNGVHQGTYAVAGTDLDGGTEGVAIGGHPASILFTFNGWIDEVRVDKGVALSTSTAEFLAPTEEYGEFVQLENDPLSITGLIGYENIGPSDLSGYYGIEFWVRSAKAIAAGDLELALYDTASAADELESFDCPALEPDTWTKVTAKFSSPADLDTVASVGLKLNHDYGQNAIYVDDIKVVRCRVTVENDDDLRTEGAGSVKIEVPGNVPDNTLLAYKDHTAIDFSGNAKVFFDIRCNKLLSYQSLQLLLDNNNACASPTESLYADANLAADAWHPVGLTLANPASDGAILSHGLKLIKQNQAPCTIYIDNIRRGAGTSGNLSGRHYAWVSYYSSKYDRESDLSPISNVIEVDGQAIGLSGIPKSSDGQVDMRKIYRSAAGGTVPYYDQTIEDNTTTVASLTKSDASLIAGTKHPSEGAGSGVFAPPQAFKYLAVKDNRILGAGAERYSRGTVDVTNGSATFTFDDADLDDSFVGRSIRVLGDQVEYLIESVNTAAGTAVARPIDDLTSGTYKGTTKTNCAYQVVADENLLYSSYIDDNNVPRPHGFPIDLAQRVEGGRPGDKITGIGTVGGAFLITKRGATFIAEGNYPPYTIGDPISDMIGGVAHKTIQTDLSGRAYWLAGKAGIVTSDGFSVVKVSQAVRKIFDGSHELGLNSFLFEQAHAILDVTNNLYYLFCASNDSSINNVCIVLDMTDTERDRWKWYYYTGIEAASSTIVYDKEGGSQIYIGDYGGFIYQFDTGYYDGIELGTLSGNPTSATSTTLTKAYAKFFTNGDGLKGLYITIENSSTGETETKKIASNTATVITIEGTWATTPTTAHNYYIGAYELRWKSKLGYSSRATDKAVLFDSAIHYVTLDNAMNLRARLYKDTAETEIMDTLHDMSDGEEAVSLIDRRISRAKWDLAAICHGEEVELYALGLRYTTYGVI